MTDMGFTPEFHVKTSMIIDHRSHTEEDLQQRRAINYGERPT